MPVPSCLGMEVSTDKVRLPPATEHVPFLGQKSVPGCGLADIGSALLKQQGMLEHVIELQRELQVLVQQQHETLESKLRPAHSFADTPLTDLARSSDERARTKGSAGTDTPVSNKERTSRGIFQGKAKKNLSFNLDPSIHEISPDATWPINNPADGLPRVSTTWLRPLVSHPAFEAVVGTIIIANFIVLCIEFQVRGEQHLYALGLRDQPDRTWSYLKGPFNVLSKCFNTVYLVELAMRLAAYGRGFFRDGVNLLDSSIVLAAAFDDFILDAVLSEGSGIFGVMRLVRLIRLARVLLVLRLFRTMSTMGAFRVLLKTINMSLDSLVCSMVVVFFIIVISALLMVQLTSPFVEDDSHSQQWREWTYNHYGSAFRATYTMFEATFSAKWATHLARPTIDEISPFFSIFWILYTVAVNFAVIRIIAALFLKQTMAVAAIDAEKMAAEKLEEKEKIIKTLRTIFKLGDQGGDGELGTQDFSQMMENPEVLKMFEELELETHELRLLFDLLSEDDGVADQEEFLFGAMKLKDNVKIVDMIQLLHQQSIIIKAVDRLKDSIERMNQTSKLNSRRPH